MPKTLAVLNIEDSEGDSDLMARLLKKAGYKITLERVETAVQMRAALKKRAWDVIISDHSLPQFDSYSALKLLREEGLDIPFIVVSGTIGEDAVVEMMKAGAHDFLIKDNLTRLIPAVERELEYAKVRRERKEIEDNLHASEKRFRALIENGLDDISLLTADGTLIWESPSVVRNLDYTPNEFVGRNMFDLMHPDDLKPIQSLFAELIQKPASRQSGTFRLRRSDGAWRWVEAIATNMLNEPSVQAIVINYRDITERKQAEEALRESESRLRTIVQSEPECIKLLDLNGRLLDMNPAGLKMIEADSLEQVQGVSIFKIVAPSYRAAFKTLNARVFKGESGTLEFEVIGLKGARRWLETHAVPFRNAQGEVTSLLGITRDITERKQAEITIRESEDRYRDLVENSQDLICTHNLEGLILTANLASARILGYEPHELIGRNLRDFLIPEVKDHFKYYLSKLSRRGSASGLLGVQTKSGERRIWEYQNTVRSEGVAEPVVRGMARDITERRQAEKYLISSEARYHSLFEDSPSALWEEDFSAVKQHLDALREQGITNFQEYFNLRPQAVIECASLVKVLDVNNAAMKLYGTNDKEGLISGIAEFIKDEPLQQFQKELVRIAEGKTSFGWEGVFKTLDGRLRNIDLSWRVVPGSEDTLSRVIVSMIDITARKQTEEALLASESSLQGILQSTADGILAVSVENKVLFTNEHFAEMWKIPQDVISRKDDAILLQYVLDQLTDPEEFINKAQELYQSEQESFDILYFKDGRIFERLSKPILNKENPAGRLWSFRDITERKKMEAALLESEHAHRTLFENVPVGLYRTTIDGRILDANPTLIRMFGYQDRESFLAMKVADLYVDPVTNKEFNKKLIKSDINAGLEAEFHKKDGTTFWTEDHIRVTRDENGNPLFYEGSMVDITERRRSEQALNKTRSDYQRLFNHANDVILIFEAEEEIILDVNAAACAIYGFSRDELIGMSLKKLTLNVTEGEAQIRDTLENRSYRDFESIHINKNGQKIYFLINASVVEYQNKEAILSINHDITERKHAEQALVKSEALYRQAMEVAGAVPYYESYYDNYEKIKYDFIGEGIRQITGYGPEEFTGALWETLVLDSRPLNELSAYSLEEAIQQVRSGEFSVWQCEYRIRHRDGGIRWVFEAAVELRDEHGTAYGSVGTYQDITDRKQAEEVAYENEARYRSLFEDSPVSLWEQDFSAVKLRLDSLRAEGIKDFRAYFASHPQIIPEYISLVKVVDVNKAALKLFGAKEKADLLQSLARLINRDSVDSFQDELISIAQGKSHFEWEGINQTLDGRQIVIRLNLSVVPGYEDTMSKVIISMVDITAHMQAEKAIRESERSLRESQMIAGLGSYVLDIPSGIWNSSEILNQIFGIDESYSQSVENWVTVIHPDWQKEMSDYFANEVLGNHIRFDKEYKIVRKNDGAERWVHGLGELEFNAQNQPVKMRGTIQDITERKQARETLEQRARELDILYDSAMTISSNLSLEVVLKTVVEQMAKAINTNGCALSFWDQEQDSVVTMADFRNASHDGVDAPGKIYSLSEYPATRRTLETREPLLLSHSNPQIDQAELDLMNEQGMSMVLLLPLVVRDRVIGLMEVYEIENKERVFTADEIRLAHSLSVQTAIFIENARLYQSVQLELSERKRAEQQMQALIEAMPDGVLVADTEGNIIVANTQSEALFGYRQDELLGHPIEMLIPEHVRGIHARHRDDYLATPKMRAMGADREMYARRQNGSEFPVNISLNTVETEQGRIVISVIRDITERKQAEENLRESEQRYRALFEDMPVSIWEEDFSETKRYLDVLKGQGLIDLREYFKHNPEAFLECATTIKVLDVNQATLKMYHADSKEDLYKSINEGLTEGEVENITDALIAIFEGKTSHSQEGVDKTATGEPIDISLSWSVAPGHEVDFSKVIVTTMDITERKHSEEALLKSEKRFRSLIANAGDLIVVIDPNGVIQFASPSSERILGYLPEEAIGRNFTEWVNPEDLSQVLSSLASRTKEQGVALESIKTRGRHKNGSWRVLDTIGTSLIHEPAIQGIVLNIRDITERELTEEALKASEAQFRAIFAGAAIGVALVDPLGHPMKVNPALEKLLGYDAQELRSMVFTDFTHPDDITADWTLWQELVASKRDHYQIEKRFIHKNGRVIWVKLTNSMIPGADGKILFGVGMVEDITERKKAEAENKYQLAELEALYENGLAISRLLEPKRIAQRMVEVIDQKLAWHHAAIRLYEASTDRVELLALNSPGFNEEQIAGQIERINQAINTPDKGLSGWVIRHGKVVRIGKLKDDPRYLETYTGINSGLYVPIITGDEVIGSITIESEQEDAFTERDEHTLTTLANQAAISFVNARLYLWLQKELDERLKAEEEIRKLNIELEQRVAERTAQIEATKRRLELATHAGQIGVWEYNPRENKVIWDERMHVIHQLPADGFNGTSEAWAQIIHPEDLGELQINRQLAFTKNLLINNEHRIIWPDGSIRYIMASAVMAYAPDGTPERIIGINMDITERKMIEQSLRESENYARLLFDAVPDPVSVTDTDGLIVDVNTVFENQFNLTSDEIRGKRIANFGIYPQSELEKRDKYVSEVLQGQVINPVELDYYVPGDRVHTLELHSYLLTVNGQQLVLNTHHDITAHKKAEETQRLAKSEIERALRIKNEFLANMSHELRTPLNSILGISESLEEQIAGTLNEKQLKYIGIVRESGRHLLDLINDILDLSKIEAGRMELDIHRISVETLCQSSLRMVKELSQKKSLHVSFKVQGDIKVILADQRRLKQSIVNLFSNAVKFTPPGKEIGLEVQGKAEKNEVEFTVWDQGVGIAQEDIQRLFKPFVQLDAGLAREYQGTGLGLALVAQMVNLHGGRVSVKSEVGKGSRFTITLPWSPNEQTPKAKVTAELVLPSPRSDEKRNGRILLVEDTDVVVQLISEYLRFKGYEIIFAHNGVEGIKLAEQERPDLILMDVMMPIMDGLEATRRIRANEMLKTIPIIALTALAMSGDSERCIAAGMNDYLSKPLQMQNLADMIEKYMHPAEKKSNDQ